MHDYNHQARIYWWTIAAIGYALLAHAVFVVAALPPKVMLQIAMCSAFVGAIAVFPVRIPGTTVSLAGGEIFIFLALFLFGAEAAAIAAAIEGAVGSARTSKRWTSWFGSPAMSAITISVSGYAFLAMRASLERQGVLTGPAMILLITVFAVVYCILSNLLPSLLLAIKRREHLEVVALLKDRSWMAVAHVGSAALAANLYYASTMVDVWLLLAALPAIALTLWSARCMTARAEKARQAQMAGPATVYPKSHRA